MKHRPATSSTTAGIHSQRLPGARYPSMKTARFTQVVTKCGKPEVHDQWLSPQKDAILKKAVKEHRLMTIHIHTIGSTKDHGVVGLAGKGQRVLLIFPKSLRSFAASRIVGIDYDLLKTPPERPVKKSAKTPSSKAVTKPEPTVKSSEDILRLFSPDQAQKVEPAAEDKHPPEKPKPKSKPPTKPKASPVETSLRSQIKRALKQLKNGKAVLAYQTLEKALQ